MKINYAKYLEIDSSLEKKFEGLHILDALRIVPEKQAGYATKRPDAVIFLNFKSAEYQRAFHDAFAHFHVTSSSLHGPARQVGYINLYIDEEHPFVVDSLGVDKAFNTMELNIRRESLSYVRTFHQILMTDYTTGRLKDRGSQITKRLQRFEEKIIGMENVGDIPAIVDEANQFFKACKMNDKEMMAGFFSLDDEVCSDLSICTTTHATGPFA